ncbi:MAG TPA: non-homologous end-joining DNA ligase [Verrucomicrobiae bacterium]
MAGKTETLPPGRKKPSSKSGELVVEGKHLPVSNLDKVLYPQTGFTKGQVIDYYIRVSKFLLPHLKDRPLTLKRYPDGVEGAYFYEKRCPPYRPKWFKTARVWSERQKEPIDFCVINNLPSLVWAANLADLELHTLLSKSPNAKRPTMMVFDLDPGPPADILNCVRVAFLLKEMLERMKLKSFPKTTGSKGLQLYVPLNTPTGYEATKPLARAMAEILTRGYPDEIVFDMKKELRTGKVLVDWSQNDFHKSTVCVYSLRAKSSPTVSTPVSWEELAKVQKSRKKEQLIFETEDALERVEKMGDLFAPVLTLKQKLPKWDALALEDLST